jgi:hypothetical protein
MKRNKKKLISAVAIKLRLEWPTGPEADLLFGVIDQALQDAFNDSSVDSKEYIREDARKFLKGWMWPAEVCGVSSSRIHWILEKANLQ